MKRGNHGNSKTVLMLASVASMIDQFNMPNIRLLQKMGYQVHVACNFKKGNTCNEDHIRKMKQVLHQMHVPWHQWDCPRSVYAVASCFRAYRQLLELTGRYRFDWIHCHSPVGGVLARLAAHQRGMRVIYTAHGFHFYQGAPVRNWLLYYPVEKLLAHWTDVLITVNQEDYILANRKLKAKKIYRVPGVGVSTVKVKQAGQNRRDFCRTYQIPERSWILLSVGELIPRKNHVKVLKAVASMGRTDVYYIICGQGRLNKILCQQAEQLGIGGRLRMAGFQENLEDFYQNCDIFVFPSIQEGLPAALMEAMTAGMPCVVSDIRGNRELIRNPGKDMFYLPESGCVRFPYHDADCLCRILLNMFADENLRKCCAQQNKKVIERYDIRKVYTEMQRIYEKMEI
ncbi:MAG: glycosyltransferase [Eubacterium sp.]|nr:glycosyltransferase [Eubacterium sp.]